MSLDRPDLRRFITAMTRRKGETTAKDIDRQFPYQVELVVPPNGFGKQLDDIYDFVRAQGLMPFGHRGGRDRRTEGIFHTTRWCFTTREHAEAFQARLGGEIFVIERKW